MRAPWHVAIATIISLTAPSLAATAEPIGEAQSIVRVMEVDMTQDGRNVMNGTGFIVSADGTVVTNSHIVSEARRDPRRYGLVLLYDGPNGREFFGAEIVCATNPPSAISSNEVAPARDAAMLRITMPTVPYRAWGYVLPGNVRYEWVRHDGPLPEFPALRLADRGPGVGEQVRIPGYGRVSALPRIHMADGRVERTFSARDGTPIFDIRSTNPPQPGNSGSPVLNGRNEIVGIWTWYDTIEHDRGTAQDVNVVRNPCR